VAKLKDMESHKGLLQIRGIVIPNETAQKVPVKSLVTTLCHRENLATVFRSKLVVFSFSRKIKWAYSIAQALEWLHMRNPKILHSRLKPSNILITTEWKTKVGDYGLGLDRDSNNNYQPPQSEEERFFVAPEVLRGGEESQEADVYSYGALLWYLFTEKKRKFASMSWETVTNHLATRNFECLPDFLPRAVGDLIFSCCSPVEASRPTFSNLLADTKWNDIIMEALNKGQQEAQDVWNAARKAGKSSNADAVLFEDLVDAYLKKFMPEVQITEAKMREDAVWRSLALFMNVTETNRMVSAYEWQKLLYFFKPLGRETTAKVRHLLSQPWFFGDISTDAAADALVANFTLEGGLKKMKGKYKRFLIRFSANTEQGDKASPSNTPVKYSVTSFHSGQQPVSPNGSALPIHQRIPSVNSADLLIKYVEDHWLKADFKPVEYTRKYAAASSTWSAQNAYSSVLGTSMDAQEKRPALSRVLGAGQSRWDDSIAQVQYVH